MALVFTPLFFTNNTLPTTGTLSGAAPAGVLTVSCPPRAAAAARTAASRAMRSSRCAIFFLRRVGLDSLEVLHQPSFACKTDGVGLLRDAFGDAGAAVLELHGRVQRRLECCPTLERACVGRSKQGAWRWGWLPMGIVEGGSSPAGALTMAAFTGRSEHCCVGMVERRNPCRHARTDVVSEPQAASQAASAGVQWV